jgi:hypothetical protein
LGDELSDTMSRMLSKPYRKFTIFGHITERGTQSMEDYKAILHEFITQAQAETKKGALGRELRFGLLERLTEWYYEKTGEMPDGIALERMSDLCLYEDLNNPSLTKMQDEEYPIMSERQFDRRQSAEIATGKRMDNNAADGQKHITPTRRNRSDYENLWMDKRAKSLNKERKRKYTEFTKVQPVIIRKMSN